MILKNQVVGYALSRYFISGLSFLTSLIVAVKLGAYYLGIWGFLLLLRRYFQIANLGVPDSVTVLLVQHKDRDEERAAYETNAIFLVFFLSIIIVLFGVVHYYYKIDFVNKYDVSWEFYVLCVIAVLTLFNDLFFKIYRVEGKVMELTFYQSIIQLFSFVVSLLFTGRMLIAALLFSYLVGSILSFVLFIVRGKIYFTFQFDWVYLSRVLHKGVYLFLFNFLFYFVLMYTRTAVSAFYKIEEFGFFTFSYTLANGIILLTDAIAALMIPKIIDKFNTKSIENIEDTIRSLWINYTNSSYVIMYLLIIVYTCLIYFIKGYYSVFDVVVYMSLTVVVQTHAFPYSTFLMARNKEKYLAFISFLTVIANVVVTWGLIHLNVSYQYVILGTWLCYLFYTILCVYFVRKEIESHRNLLMIVRESFPLRLFLPVIVLLLITILDIRVLVVLPLLLFVLLNKDSMVVINNTLRKILVNPQIIDIRK